MDHAVKIKGIRKSFGDVKAVKKADFDIHKGEIFGIIGPDGAGKTTLLRILSGIMNPDSGSARILGFEIPGEEEALKEKTGYMPQKFSLYTDLTVEENIKFFADIFGISSKVLAERTGPLFKMTRLDPFRNRLAGNLSGGMKQKLALMASLIPRPGFLILDEPTTGVDPVSRREFWEILQQIRAEGVTILVSTPYMDEAEWCSRVGLMFEGEMLFVNSPVEIKRSLKSIVIETDSSLLSNEMKNSLKDFRGVSDFQILGSRYRIVFETMKAFEDFSKNKIIQGMRQIPVSIEDVFVNEIKRVKNE